MKVFLSKKYRNIMGYLQVGIRNPAVCVCEREREPFICVKGIQFNKHFFEYLLQKWVGMSCMFAPRLTEGA